MKKVVVSFMLSGALVAQTLSAQVLDMPAEPAAEDSSVESVSITLPGRGMSKDQVEARFGAPDNKVSAVGEPPISRWIYGSFTVYFEHELVLHSVLHRR